jgi:hypothetical protein
MTFIATGVREEEEDAITIVIAPGGRGRGDFESEYDAFGSRPRAPARSGELRRTP